MLNNCHKRFNQILKFPLFIVILQNLLSQSKIQKKNKNNITTLHKTNTKIQNQVKILAFVSIIISYRWFI